MVRENLLLRVRQDFAQQFGTTARPALAAAPGRVNVIGEHTDYNAGFVLPMAIDRHIAIAFAPRSDRVVRAYAAEFGQVRELSLETLELRSASESGWSRRGGWFGYVAGVAWAYLRAGQRLGGADLAIAGDLPVGAGLSSSAAIEIAAARVLTAVSDIPWDARAAALLAQRAEHEFAGVACGIMDQLSVAAAREGCALLIDCRSLETRDVPIPDTARILVFDSGVRRQLAGSAYNDRRGACERVVAAARALQPDVEALRDVDETLLAACRDTLDPVDVRRAMHVIAENRRPCALAEAFAVGDLRCAGRLMRDSHRSLRDLYEVSSPELDTLVELALSQPGCLGARLTGAGFGGCVIALVEAGSVERVMSFVETGYEERTGRVTNAFVCRPSAGASLVGS